MSTGAARLLLILLILGATLGSAIGPAGAVGTASTFFPFVVKGYSPPSTLAITNVVDNRGSFPNASIPKYDKLEISFQINGSVASNYAWPYDPNPPDGVPIGSGITINAQFTQDNFQTIYTQPAFYYQDFDYQIKGNREWIYPSDRFGWKVRFAPTYEGAWRYRIVAQDASGTTTSTTQTFTVVNSANKGFVRASKRDSRYFEFEDGTYFPGLGYNMNYNRVNWVNPVLDNQQNFQKMGLNGIQLTRIWLSQWAIFGSSWNPWYGLRGDYDGYIPRPGLLVFGASSSEAVSVKLGLAYTEDASGSKNTNWFEACRFIGDTGASPPAIKQNTLYHFRVKYRAYDISGPRNPSFPNYGFVIKTQNPVDGNWHRNCFEPGSNNSTGQVISTYSHNTSDWSYLEGEWNFGARDFLPNFYLALENVNSTNPSTARTPYVFIDSVEIREKLSDGSLGPNIVAKPSMEHQLYFEQRNSYAFDKVLELARQYGVYLKPVILEKNEVILNWIDDQGNFVSGFDNNRFYGDYRQVTKVRWLQQAWWRYLQARWGYSPNIHSWELINEGDPFNDRHYTLADEFGKYMKQFAPNDHMVTTSFWHSFPRDQFWANANYPNIDYADVHQYVARESDPTNFNDTARATESLSRQIGAKTAGGANKPTMRGETGFTESGTEPGTSRFASDTQGIWLQKFIWAQINPGGLIESYWYDNSHIYGSNFDHRDKFGRYYGFIADTPLNNGNYQDISASATNANLRVLGQKDLVNGRAHLWIDNITHTWNNVVNNPSAVIPQSGTVSFSGMPQGAYTISWYDTYSGAYIRTESVSTDATGTISLSISSLQKDLAVKIQR